MTSSRARRIEIFVLLGALTAMGPAAMDMYFPALPSMARSFDVPSSALQLTLTTFLVGLALGQLVAGPLSDVFGRKRPLLAGVGCYAVASAACALAQSVELLTAARFAQGFSAAAGIAIGRAIIKDLYAGRDLARAYARLFLVIGLAPVVAPSLGALVLRTTSWRGIFVVLVGLGGVLFALGALRLPETLPPEQRRPGGLSATLRSFGRLLSNGRFVGYGLTLGLSMAAVVVTLSGAPFVIQDGFGRSPQVYALVFLLAALSMMAATSSNGRLLRRWSERRLLLFGCTSAAAAGVGMALSSRIGLWGFVPCFAVLFGTWGFVPANAVALGLRDHGRVAGGASALLGVMQYGIGGLAAPLAGAGGNAVTRLGLMIAGLAGSAALIAAVTVRRDRDVERTATAAAHAAEARTAAPI
jgi:DHA1 family bicyclomycin/chloramphenicol resistance-like MFS transporter